MGLIGYYLALNYQTKNNDYRFDLNHYDISNINYSDLEINGDKYNKSNVRQPFYFYLGDEEGHCFLQVSNIKIL